MTRAEPEPADEPLAELLSSIGIRPDDARTVTREVVERYGEPHRRYHTWTHIAFVRARLDELTSQGPAVPDPRALRLAADLHDVVYDPRASDNEERSAEFALARLLPLGADRGVVERCAELIRCTATHTGEGYEASVLLDADLSILSADPQAYRSYVQQVREEYAFVPSAHWRTGRAAVLRGLLDRERLYLTDVGARGEAMARRNMTEELATLADPPVTRSGAPG